MTITPVVYGRFLDSVVQGMINVKTHEIRGILCTASYIPNQGSQQFKSSVTNECVGSGYAAGGKIITGIDTTYSAKTLTITGGALLWPGVTVSPRYLVVYDNSAPTEATKPLILYVDFGATQTLVGQNLNYTFPANVLCRLVVP